MKDYSIQNGSSYATVCFHDDEFVEVQNEETGDYEEVYIEFFKIEHVFVSTEARGKGLAKSMIRDAISSIKADFPEARIVLAALPEADHPIDQEGLVSLYKSVGFEVVADQEGSAAVIMEYSK